MISRTFTTFLLLTLLFADDAARMDEAPLARMAVIGASMSDGFLLPLEVDCMVTVADVAQATCAAADARTVRSTSSLFFLDAIGHGTRQVEAALAAKPTLVLGLDYLFWFGYGGRLGLPSDADARLAALETGLALIGRFECPVVVGDFPDMHAALKGVSITGGPIIGPRDVPDVDVLVRLNARLHDWVADHPNVHVLALADLSARLRAGTEIRLRDNTWTAGSQAALIDGDLLHPTLDGTIAVVLHALDLLSREDPRFAPECFEWNRTTIRERVLKARRAEREARVRMKERRTAGTTSDHR